MRLFVDSMVLMDVLGDFSGLGCNETGGGTIEIGHDTDQIYDPSNPHLFGRPRYFQYNTTSAGDDFNLEFSGFLNIPVDAFFASDVRMDYAYNMWPGETAESLTSEIEVFDDSTGSYVSNTIVEDDYIDEDYVRNITSKLSTNNIYIPLTRKNADGWRVDFSMNTNVIPAGGGSLRIGYCSLYTEIAQLTNTGWVNSYIDRDIRNETASGHVNVLKRDGYRIFDLTENTGSALAGVFANFMANNRNTVRHPDEDFNSISYLLDQYKYPIFMVSFEDQLYNYDIENPEHVITTNDHAFRCIVQKDKFSSEPMQTAAYHPKTTYSFREWI